MRFLFLAGLLGCSKASDSDTDIADTDGPSAAQACEYGELAGSWVGEMVVAVPGGEAVAQLAVDLDASADEDERIGLMNFDVEIEGETLHCVDDLICTGRDQNEWRVMRASTQPGENCISGWAFFTVDQDGGLVYEFGSSEFGERNDHAVLERAN